LSQSQCHKGFEDEAAIRSFVTYYSDFNMNLYTHIALELYLKKLIENRLDRVYEIGKQFRNKGVVLKH